MHRTAISDVDHEKQPDLTTGQKLVSLCGTWFRFARWGVLFGLCRAVHSGDLPLVDALIGIVVVGLLWICMRSLWKLVTRPR